MSIYVFCGREERAIFKNTYRPWDEETGEEIPKGEEEGHANGGNLVAWRECNQHHPIESEVYKAHEHEIEEPEEFGRFPCEVHHREQQEGIDQTLHCYVYYFNAHLQERMIPSCSYNLEGRLCEKLFLNSKQIWTGITCANAYGNGEYIPAARSR